MTSIIRIMEWNANGLHKHKYELEVLLAKENIDICLICETHFTKESYLKFEEYKLHCTNHPSNNARGGSAILVRKNIDYYEEDNLCLEEFQATTITVKTSMSLVSFTSVYIPPKHNIKCDKYIELINKHKYKFIMGGDFNAKHTYWGSRLTNTKGKELFQAIEVSGSECISTGCATYWPTDKSKQPDLIDFFITRKISKSSLEIREGYDLNSDHSPIYLTAMRMKKKKVLDSQTSIQIGICTRTLLMKILI